jgi:2-oxoglutarate ferredoxin oxidoreductase subunit beta
VGEVGFVPFFEDISVEYDPDTCVDVRMHDGSRLTLRKLHEGYDPTDKTQAVKMLMESHDKGECLTGIFYVDTQKTDFSSLLNTVDEPLATLAEERTRPGREVLKELMEEYS